MNEKYSRTTDEYVCSETYVSVLRDWYLFLLELLFVY